MRTKAKYVKEVEAMKKSFLDSYNAVEERKVKELKDAQASGDVQKIVDALTGIVDTMDVVSTAMGEGEAQVPAHITKTFVSEDGSSLDISVRSKKATGFKYRRDVNVAVTDDVVEKIGTNIYSICYDLYTQKVARENVVELNKVLDTVVSENEIPYTVQFVIDDNANGIVSDITDKSVVFVATISEALDIPTNSLMLSGDNYTDLIRKEATDKLIAALKVAQTPVQLIANKVELITTLTGLKTKKRVSKQLRDTYHKNVKYIKEIKKACSGYFHEKVDIDGDEVDVFAIVDKDEKGNLSVRVSPFDTVTCMKVDYDVLANI